MIHSFGNHQILSAPDYDEFSIDIPQLDSNSPPDFNSLFDDEPPAGTNTATSADLRVKKFIRIEKLLDTPKPWFTADFYKILLSGEGEISKKVHQLLQDFLKATDSQDKSLYRGRFIPAYWDLYAGIASRIGTRLPEPKLLLLRYGVLLPTAIEADQRQLIASIPFRNDTGEPVFYLDEWLKDVAHGRVSTSSVDETKSARGNEGARHQAMLEKARGRHQAQIQLITGIATEMQNYEQMVVEHAQNVARHSTLPAAGNNPAPYTDQQRSSFSEIADLMRKLSLMNKKLMVSYSELETLQEQLDSLLSREGDFQQDNPVDSKVITEEMNTVKQMHKMCVGRQGNHFPMLMKSYFRGNIRDMATRENTINTLADIEYFDAGIFLRTFKQQTNRIVPNIILIPSYGDYGVCWEPFERGNKATSRGRVAIPMYPKDLRIAVIAAMADLRWQVAKEKAQHYWMEEGLTGWYYQYFSDKKMKGDVKDQFIEDYILWITKETDGTQKLEREVRDIFWRYIPFPQELKDKLKNRGFVYAELAKKDFNRSISDGY